MCLVLGDLEHKISPRRLISFVGDGALGGGYGGLEVRHFWFRVCLSGV